jgi:NTP pyrophosphatase (non-canonical NTP hydrolase)
MEKVIKKIIEWGASKGFVVFSNRFQQITKLSEEVGELSSAVLKGDKVEQIDAIGDIQVVLILLSEMLGHDYEKCLESAYDVIKDRKGVVKDGTFIKDEK